MKIRESANLKYDKVAKVSDYPQEYEREDLEPRVCILEFFEKQNGNLNLYFKNKSHALVRAVNIEGEREMDLVTDKLEGFLNKSYEEILETEF